MRIPPNFFGIALALGGCAIPMLLVQLRLVPVCLGLRYTPGPSRARTIVAIARGQFLPVPAQAADPPLVTSGT